MATVRMVMRHRADIQRPDPTQVQDDDYGTINDTTNQGTYIPYLTAVPCFLFTPVFRQRGEVVGELRIKIVDHLVMLLPKEVDIHENDHVSLVTDRLGNIIEDRLLDVRQVVKRGKHVMIDLQAVETGMS